jgi:catechol 2,3-dioxygenase-like lactoylglutathione lyase family enzyme
VAQSLDDLQELAAREGVPVAASPHPGGGMMAALRDPDNYLVEIVANRDVRPATSLPASNGWNDAREKARIRVAKRVAPGPATVVRLGHVVLGVSDFRVSEAWYKERFGFITSDEIVAPDGTTIGAFLRCDRQDQLTDHHSLFLIQGRGAAFNHAAFEVVDTDDLFVGHDWLRTAGWQAHWGIGRHVLGSQIFDYWRDPWGHTLEHWTDGDLLIAADGSRRADLSELRAVQWGPTAPN